MYLWTRDLQGCNLNNGIYEYALNTLLWLQYGYTKKFETHKTLRYRELQKFVHKPLSPQSRLIYKHLQTTYTNLYTKRPDLTHFRAFFMRTFRRFSFRFLFFWMKTYTKIQKFWISGASTVQKRGRLNFQRTEKAGVQLPGQPSSFGVQLPVSQQWRCKGTHFISETCESGWWNCGWRARTVVFSSIEARRRQRWPQRWMRCNAIGTGRQRVSIPCVRLCHAASRLHWFSIHRTRCFPCSAPGVRLSANLMKGSRWMGFLSLLMLIL